MKRFCCILACALTLFGCAFAEQTVRLPDSRYAVEVPDWMRFRPDPEYPEIHAYTSEMLEMDYTSYLKTATLSMDSGKTLRETVRELADSGAEAELREINGIEMICFRAVDSADGAPCIGYVFEDGDRMIEIDFWYSTQEAANLTKTIMESIRAEE